MKNGLCALPNRGGTPHHQISNSLSQFFGSLKKSSVCIFSHAFCYIPYNNSSKDHKSINTYNIIETFENTQQNSVVQQNKHQLKICKMLS
jgi:hypothetical protein